MASLMRVRYVSTGWVGGPGLNTFYFRPAGAGIVDDAAALAAVSRVTAFFGDITTGLPGNWTGQVDTAVAVLNDTTGALIDEFVTSDPGPQAGADAQTFGPAMACAGIRFRTGTFINGRRLQGKAFIGPLPDNSADDDGTLREVFADLISTSAEANLVAGPSPTDDIFQAVWHRPSGPSATDGSSAEVITATVPTRYYQLGSRKR